MATMRANGMPVVLATHPDFPSFDLRIMSNGVMLKKRPGGAGFKKLGKIKPKVTFATTADQLRAKGFTIKRVVALLPPDDLPRPVKRRRW